VTAEVEVIAAAPAPAPASTTRPGTWPALDGLRGLAVIAVLLFHGDFPWASGGFLGVSTFFTLSGFLITTLLVAEHRRSDTIDRPAFLRRRARRLLPAALAGLVVVVVFGVTVATADQQRNLFGDVVGALTYTINWRFILAGQSYAQLFAAPSPLQHFWSLAIEGQFYLVFPFVAAWALGRRSGRSAIGRLAVVVGLAMAVSLALTLWAGYSQSRIFYGTDTRAFELLAGAALALLLAGRRPTGAPSARGPVVVRGLVAFGGIGAVAACLFLWHAASLSSGWVYEGGLPAYSLLSALIVAAVVVVPRSPVARVLALRPLRAVGLISYGLYVFHWPVFLWLTPARTHLSLGPDFVLRVAVTTAMALLSYWLVEVPVRERRWARPPSPARLLPVLATATAIVVLIGALAVTARAAPPANDFAAARRALNHPTARATSPGDTRPSVAWFGDSTGLVLAEGSVYDAGGPVRVINKGGQAGLGCSVGPAGRRRLTDGQVVTSSGACDDQLASYGAFVDRTRPDMAVVLYGPNDLYDREVPGVCSSWCHIGDAAYDRWLDEQMLGIVDVLDRQGALVVWLTTPTMPELGERSRLFNQMVEQLPAERPGKVVNVDLGGYLAATGKDVADRPDGIHLSDTAAVVVGQGWLVPQLVSVWDHRH
jgi:peptidoglycan/LPS O-acetylase OafA/YrhL